MIPKIIHWCWLSEGELPQNVKDCITSWKKHLPDYEIKLWNKDSFDFSSVEWTRQALECGKFAFVSDFIRFYALYNFGGIYLDSDVEVIKSFDPFLNQKFFFGYEYSALPEAAVIAGEAGCEFARLALEWYKSRPFKNQDGSSNATVAPLVLKYFFEKTSSFKLLDDKKIHSVCGGSIFTSDYFSPKNPFTGKIRCTQNTVTIHRFNSGWLKKSFTVRIKALIHLALIAFLRKRLYNALMYKIRKPFKKAGGLV